jgi:TRAP-type C4-dicarboxylate transport system substrate-binding protein
MTHRSFILGSVAALALALPAGVAPAQEFTFTLEHVLPAPAPAQKNMLEPWARSVEEDSGGRIKIDIIPTVGLEAGAHPRVLASHVRDGIADIVWTVNGYTPEVFPRTEVFELPGVFNGNLTASNLAMRDIFDEYLAEEYPGVKVIVLHVHGGQGIQMKSKLVRKPEDLAGTRMRIPTRTGAWLIEALGADPVQTGVGEIPQRLETNEIDGAFIPWEIIPAFKIQQQTKYQIEGPNPERFGTTTFQISMNLDSYNSLPDDLKAVIDQNSGEEFARFVADAWRGAEEGGLNAALNDPDDSDPNELIVLTEDEMQAFRDALEPVNQRWIDDVTARGIDGQALYDAAVAAVAKHSGQM